MVVSFRIGKIPVEIQPSFFLMALILGGFGSLDLGAIATWVGVVLVSVLLHELGHASVGLLFGLSPRIQLHSMGGTTSWQQGRKLSSLKRIAISIAGPAAGFLFGAAIFFSRRSLVALVPGHAGSGLVALLLYVNVAWGILNLLPMLPLDGGSVVLHSLNAFTGGRGDKPTLVVSLGCACAAVILAVAKQWWWSAFLALSFVASNWRGLKNVSAAEHDAPMRASLERAYAALDEKNAVKIVEIARPVALQSRTPSVRAEALQLLAFGFLLEGRVADADAAVAAMPKGFSPHPSLTQLRQTVSSAAPR